MIRAALIWAIMALVAVPALAMGLFAPGRPTDVTFNDAAHHATPVMVDGLEINGTSMGRFPQLASMDWMNPRGGPTTLTTLPWDGDDDQTVDVRAEWTEIASGRAYSAELSVPWSELTIETVIEESAYMTFVYGRDGEFMLFTSAEPDPKTGQYNGREVARTCGQREPARDQNYGLRVNEIPGLGPLMERRAQWMAMEKADTSCDGEGA